MYSVLHISDVLLLWCALNVLIHKRSTWTRVEGVDGGWFIQQTVILHGNQKLVDSFILILDAYCLLIARFEFIKMLVDLFACMQTWIHAWHMRYACLWLYIYICDMHGPCDNDENWAWIVLVFVFSYFNLFIATYFSGVFEHLILLVWARGSWSVVRSPLVRFLYAFHLFNVV